MSEHMFHTPYVPKRDRIKVEYLLCREKEKTAKDFQILGKTISEVKHMSVAGELNFSFITRCTVNV